MSDDDRMHWDTRYGKAEVVTSINELPRFLTDHLTLVPRRGVALDMACGRGHGSLWMAARGLQVNGVDVSAVAVSLAEEGAGRFGLVDRCRFEVHDLDDGLPRGEAYPDRYDMILCHLFRDPALYPAMVDHLAPGGLVSVAVLSEQQGPTGRYRAGPNELLAAFGNLDVHDHGHAAGRTWLVATKPHDAPRHSRDRSPTGTTCSTPIGTTESGAVQRRLGRETSGTASGPMAEDGQ